MTPSLHLISTGRQNFSELSSIVMTIQQSFDYLHIREKQRSPEEIYNGVTQLIEVGFPRDRIIINDHADIAAATGSRGVHLPSSSLPISQVKRIFPDMIIGKSVHSLEEAIDAEKEGADYSMFGNLYSTSCKPGKPGKGVTVLKDISRHLQHPLIGIGGITPSRTSEVLKTGVGGIAVMSGILLSNDPEKAIRAYVHEWKGVHPNGAAF